MNKKRLIAIFLLVAAISTVVFMNFGKTKTKAYYSGDAIEYNGQLVVASANTGYLELFRIDSDNKPVNLAKFQAPVDGQVKSNVYNDVLLNIEDGNLYVYAVSGTTLYKYDFSNLSSLNLVNTVRDTTWDWLGHLDKADGRIMTSGTKAVKIWNYDLQVVDIFKLSNTTNPYNVSLDDRGRYIFNINGSTVEAYDRDFRKITSSFPITVNLTAGNRKLYFDAPANMFYVVDDATLRKISLDGNVYKSINHPSGFSYDVVGSMVDDNYIYSANGRGVAKFNKKDLSLAAHFKSYKFTAPNSWAMGLKVVDTRKGEVVVVFNNSNIVILDKNLKPFATIIATDEDANVKVLEGLSLSADKNSGTVLTNVAVSGTGFGTGETVSIVCSGVETRAKADDQGRFSATITIPATAKDKTGVDIKATGLQTSLTYSMGFRIIQ